MKKIFLLSICSLAFILLGSSVSFSEQSGSAISAEVLETMDSGGYTYLQIEVAGQKEWYAIPKTELKVGQKVSILPGMEMKDFKSKSLDRTFDKIQFSPGLADGKMPPHGMMMMGHGKKPAPAQVEKIEVEKASGPNGYTVSEIYEKSTELASKAVSVRGKVVKASANILGKNWIHIQDGTGDPTKGNHDLVVSSQDLPQVGDIVTINGTLAKDKDLGSGYRYAALIEEATVSKN